MPRAALQTAAAKGAVMTVEEIRRLLDVNGYPEYPEFKRRVIKPAIDEINKCSEDIHVLFYPMRGEHGRNIEKINFVIEPAGGKQQYHAGKIRKKKLDHINPYGVNDV